MAEDKGFSAKELLKVGGYGDMDNCDWTIVIGHKRRVGNKKWIVLNNVEDLIRYELTHAG